MQKAVVVISDRPEFFGAVKAALGVVVEVWFAQRDFTDIEILQRFQESLPQLLKNQEGQMDHYFGMKGLVVAREDYADKLVQAYRSASSYMSSSGRRWFCLNVLYFSQR